MMVARRRSLMPRSALLLLLIGLPMACSRQKPSSDRTHTVDEAVLSSFKSAYSAAGAATRPVFDKFLPLLGAKPILDFLEEKYPACHIQAHDLGRALFAQTGDLDASLQQCDSRCTAGCMHGVLAGAFGGSTAQAITAKANTFCTEGEMARLHRPGNCAHGMGHALMFVMGGNVRRSVDGCLGFALQAMQYYCATGVYMEAATQDPHWARPLSSVHHPCNEEMLFPAACYRYKGPALLAEFGGYRGAEKECLRLDRLHRLGCLHGLGQAAIGSVFDIPLRMATMCRAGDRDDKVACIDGVIEKLAEFNQYRANTACATLEGDMREMCNQAAARQMYALDSPSLALYYDRDALARRTLALTDASAPPPASAPPLPASPSDPRGSPTRAHPPH